MNHDHERMTRLNAIRAELGFVVLSDMTAKVLPDVSDIHADIEARFTINKRGFADRDWAEVTKAVDMAFQVLREDLLTEIVDRRRRLGLPTTER